MRRSRTLARDCRTARSRSASPAWRSRSAPGWSLVDAAADAQDRRPEVRGAAALADQPAPQQSADGAAAEPAGSADRPLARVHRRLPGRDRRHQLQPLPYGDPNGKHTVILFGDSHAMQYFPPLEELAKQPRWRLIALTKAECPPGEVEVRSMIEDREYSQCDDLAPELAANGSKAGDRATTVVMSGDTEYTPYGPNGEELRAKPPRKRWKPATCDPAADPGGGPGAGRDPRQPGLRPRRPQLRLRRPRPPRSLRLPAVHDWDSEFDVRAAEATRTPT